MKYYLLWFALRIYAFLRPRREVGQHVTPPLITRWFLTSRPKGTETGTPGWYLHRINRPDAVRSEHCHPWTYGTLLVLRGQYIETRDGEHYVRRAGDSAVLWPNDYHCIVDVSPNTWTLFHAGEKHGAGWGFRTRQANEEHGRPVRRACMFCEKEITDDSNSRACLQCVCTRGYQ
jgi:hypothetical protein